jgi:hypothetical protein
MHNSRYVGVAPACTVRRVLHHAGEVVLEYLLLQPAEECVILGLRNSTEAIAIGSCYLWWERRKLVHNEKIHEPKFIAIATKALVATILWRVMQMRRSSDMARKDQGVTM